MPQRAMFRDHRRVQAWEADDALWDGIATASRSGDLFMPCCGVRAVAKTSPLGLRFFAHWPTPGLVCAWANTSIEHERLKIAVCRAAIAAGFQAQTEVSDPDGAWRTDCLISDAGGKPVMAVEIQLSRIPLGEIDRRQDNLVRCLPMACWFVGPALGRYLVQPRAHLASWSLSGVIEEAERQVTDKVTRLLTGQLVWHPHRPTTKRGRGRCVYAADPCTTLAEFILPTCAPR